MLVATPSNEPYWLTLGIYSDAAEILCHLLLLGENTACNKQLEKVIALSAKVKVRSRIYYIKAQREDHLDDRKKIIRGQRPVHAALRANM